MQQTSPIEAYRKFDTISSKHTELLRKYTKQVQEARANNEEESIKKHINDYEVNNDQVIPTTKLIEGKIMKPIRDFQLSLGDNL